MNEVRILVLGGTIWQNVIFRLIVFVCGVV